MTTEQTTTEAPPPKFDLSVLPPAMQAVRAQYDLAVRQAKAYAESSLVPQQYRGDIPNCIIAVNMANRVGMDVLMVMQNLYIVHGNPGWSGKFLIAAFNQCGRFSAMRFETRGDVDAKEANSGMRAHATEKATGEVIRGPWVTWAMVKGEKWDAKEGSKWKTMPELMFMYRAAAFLTRTHAPEIAMGLQTVEELHDTMIDVTPVGEARERVAAPSAIDRAKAAVGQVLEGEKAAAAADDAPNEILPHVLEALDAATTRDKLDDAAIRIDGIRDLEEREAARVRYHERLTAIEPEGK